MRDEDILSALRAAAKADAAAVDPALERLAKGECTPEERARLEAEAERSEEGAGALEAFRPLDPLVRARMKRAVRRSRAPRRGRLFLGGLIAAAACALAIVASRPSAPPLPPYGLEMSSTDRLERGELGQSASVVSPGSILEIVARPADVAGPVQAVLLIRSAAGTTRRPLEVSPSGAVRARGQVSDLLGGAQGSVELLIAVGRGADVESFDGREAHEDGRSARLVWWTRKLVIAAP